MRGDPSATSGWWRHHRVIGRELTMFDRGRHAHSPLQCPIDPGLTLPSVPMRFVSPSRTWMPWSS